VGIIPPGTNSEPKFIDVPSINQLIKMYIALL